MVFLHALGNVVNLDHFLVKSAMIAVKNRKMKNLSFPSYLFYCTFHNYYCRYACEYKHTEGTKYPEPGIACIAAVSFSEHPIKEAAI